VLCSDCSNSCRVLPFDWIPKRYRSTKFSPVPSFLLRHKFGLSMPELSSAPNFRFELILFLVFFVKSFQLIRFLFHRPTFHYFSWHTALLGLTGTMVMMFVINPVYASVSLLLCLILIIMLHFFSPARTANWGSISQAIIFHQV
jgi:uncharacterized membrane protein